MTRWTVSTILALALLLNGCTGMSRQEKGSGKIVSREVAIPAANSRVDVAVVGNVIIHLGDNPSVKITGDENLLEYINVSSDGEKLRLNEHDGVVLVPSQPIIYDITLKKIEHIVVAGATVLKSADQLVVGDLKVGLNGSGTIDLDISGNSVIVRLGGSGNVKLTGDVHRQTIDLSGAGSYHGYDLESDEATVFVSGAGTVMLSAAEKLDVDISGVGSVIYKGVPTIKKNISGMGSLRHYSEK